MRTVLLMGLLALAWGCDGGNVSTRVPDPDDVYPSPPMAFSGRLIYVNVAYPGCEAGDGSRARPFCRIGRALESPVGPLAVLVAAGAYPEAVEVRRSEVWILGAVGADGGRPRIAPSPAGVGLTVEASAQVTVAGLQVGPMDGIGVLLNGAQATLQDLRVQGIRASEALPGDGVVAVGGSRIDGAAVSVEDVERTGVLISDVDEAGGSLAITGLVVRAFGAGGVSAQGDVTVALEDPQVEQGGLYGIGGYGAAVEITGGWVRQIARAQGLGGDGIVGAAQGGVAAELSISGVEVSGSARVGLLADGAGGQVDHLTATDNGGGGLWVLGSETLTLADSALAGNAIVGLAALGDVTLSIERVAVDGVDPGTALRDGRLEDVGDGALVLDAVVDATDLSLRAAHRAGLIVDGGRVDWRTGEVASTRFGVVLQNGGQLGDEGLSFIGITDSERLEPEVPLPVVTALEDLSGP